MGYYIDLRKISIDHYKVILNTSDLLPSWQILRDNIDQRMDSIKATGTQNLEQLKAVLKTKLNVKEFARKTGLSEDYLMVLRRVINGYHSKPNRFQDIPNLESRIVNILEKHGFKNTRQLYPEILSPHLRTSLGLRIGLSEAEVLKLTKLTDLSRIKWVNCTFAYVLFECGYDTAEKVANANDLKLYNAVKKLNTEQKIFPAHIGIHDINRCIESARWLKFEIEY